MHRYDEMSVPRLSTEAPLLRPVDGEYSSQYMHDSLKNGYTIWISALHKVGIYIQEILGVAVRPVASSSIPLSCP